MENTSAKVRVSKTFGAYNWRRFSKPWIAIVTSWPVGDKPSLSFGGYVGNDEGGEAEILARPGDIVRWGQRDNRGGRTENEWGIVEPDGSIREVTQPEARKHYAASVQQ